MTDPVDDEEAYVELATRRHSPSRVVDYFKRVFFIWLLAVVVFTVLGLDNVQVASDWLWAFVDSLVFTTPLFLCFASTWAICKSLSVPLVIELAATWIAFFLALLVTQATFALLFAEEMNVVGAMWWGVWGLSVPLIWRILNRLKTIRFR